VIGIKINSNCKSAQEALNSLVLKYLSDMDSIRSRSNEDYNQLKDDDDSRQRLKEYKANWLQANKENTTRNNGQI